MYMGVQNPGADGKTRSPDASEQLISSAHGWIRLHQGLEDGEGFGRKSNRLAGDSHLVLVPVQLNGTNAVDPARGDTSFQPPQAGANGGG
jgi:hypothetical protein